MKLVFYSGGGVRANRLIGRESLSLLPENPRIAFIPAEAEYAEEDFREFRREFRALGIQRLENFPLPYKKKTVSRAFRESLFSADAIYIGGGNTFTLLHDLRKLRLLPSLKRYARSGGVLLGQSAGSIVLTPTIEMARVPKIEEDENEVGIEKLDALGLVSFEFSPHYRGQKKADEELREYSKTVDYPVYACRDGHGIVVKNGKISFIGKPVAFVNGRKATVH